ncbi:MAG: BrnT family toxin [Gammaproteobacteria bacterium]|nr:BrnT family toxin [Gammaproteobacteria bacterium]
MHFSWDENKNRANRLKHGVSFELAQEVFDDPLALSRLDRIAGSEQRWHTLGRVEGVLLLVSHTAFEHEGEEVIRIISARKATAHERRQYEQD